MFACIFTQYSTPFGVKNSSFNHSAEGHMRRILSWSHMSLSTCLKRSGEYKSLKEIRIKFSAGIKFISISSELARESGNDIHGESSYFDGV